MIVHIRRLVVLFLEITSLSCHMHATIVSAATALLVRSMYVRFRVHTRFPCVLASRPWPLLCFCFRIANKKLHALHFFVYHFL